MMGGEGFLMDSTIRETPASLVRSGEIETGFFALPFRDVKLLDAKNMGGRFGKPLRWLRLKEWVGFGIDHPRLFGGIIIQNAKYAASGTVYLYDKQTRRMNEWLIVDSPTRVKLPEHLWNGVSLCKNGKNVLHFEHDLNNGRHLIHASIESNRHRPALRIELELFQNWQEIQPLVVSLPIKPDHHTYTHKAPVELDGVIRIGAETHTFLRERDLANLDEQKTFYPYRSTWKWGGFVQRTQSGHLVMANFVNQMTPPELPGEDCMWVDGRLMLLEQPRIFADSIRGNFRLEDKSGRIHLVFTADGSKVEKLNFGLIRMDYEQFYGNYNGELQDEDGVVHRISNAFGPLECMNARF
jgi:hypothetical protein